MLEKNQNNEKDKERFLALFPVWVALCLAYFNFNSLFKEALKTNNSDRYTVTSKKKRWIEFYEWKNQPAHGRQHSLVNVFPFFNHFRVFS